MRLKSFPPVHRCVEEREVSELFLETGRPLFEPLDGPLLPPVHQVPGPVVLSPVVVERVGKLVADGEPDCSEVQFLERFKV